MADEKNIDLIDHSEFAGQSEEQFESRATVEYQAPPEAPKFGLRKDVENNETIQQVEPIDQVTPVESDVETENRYTSENFGSKENAEKALILQGLLEHGVKIDELNEMMNRVNGLSADSKD